MRFSDRVHPTTCPSPKWKISPRTSHPRAWKNNTRAKCPYQMFTLNANTKYCCSAPAARVPAANPSPAASTLHKQLQIRPSHQDHYVRTTTGTGRVADSLISIGTAVSSCKRKKSSWNDYNVLNSSVQLHGASKTIKSQLWEEAWCLTLPLCFPYSEASKIQKSIATIWLSSKFCHPKLHALFAHSSISFHQFMLLKVEKHIPSF